MQKTMKLNELREKFLKYYSERGHVVIPSAALVPENDPSTLFTSSGMQPLVPYLLGKEHPAGTRICDSQKCFRSNDIEEVGDSRHTTFFEMLGNWSLGDYFKQEQIPWIWHFLTEEVGLPAEKLFVTVFAGNAELGIGEDEEAIEIWKKMFAEKGIGGARVEKDPEKNGMFSNEMEAEPARIFCYGEKKNWWSRSGVPAAMPVGEPGGPDTEIFYDFGAELGLHESSAWANEPCHVNCDCGRFVEIGNSVFMQYGKADGGGFAELAQRNVDYGGGLERLIMAAENRVDIFTTSTFAELIAKIEELTGINYEAADLAQKQAFRVIADHARASVMLLADGILPSNKEQGYVLRRLIRRAIRWARRLNLQADFMVALAEIVVATYEGHYPEVRENAERVKQGLADEEKKFGKTIEKGLKEIEKMEKLDGAAAFKLYESFGFPWELTQEIAAERGEKLSEADFQAALQAHKDSSRDASAGKFRGGLQDAQERTVRFHTATHLLHKALRDKFGESVQQKGSNITAERARFDFSFDRALTSEEIADLEKTLNEWIAGNYGVSCVNMAKADALESGALHFFVEKYPDEVSVYTIQNDSGQVISKEICMGPHVSRTGELGGVKIAKEKASAAGIRRIYLELI